MCVTNYLLPIGCQVPIQAMKNYWFVAIRSLV